VASQNRGAISRHEQLAQVLDSRPPRQRDRFLGQLGEFRSAKQLIVLAATGLR